MSELSISSLTDEQIDRLSEAGYTSAMEVAVESVETISDVLEVSQSEAETTKQDIKDGLDAPGFTSAATPDVSADFRTHDFAEPPVGWDLLEQSKLLVKWESLGGYEISVAPKGYADAEASVFEVKGVLPPTDGSAGDSEEAERFNSQVLLDDIASEEAAIEVAFEEMNDRALPVTDELTMFPGIGMKEAVYLQLEYSVREKDDMEELWDDGTLQEVVSGTSHDELADVFTRA